jgi:hypothetical protein
MIDRVRVIGARAPQNASRVLLVAQAAYHLAELVPLRDALAILGVPAEIVAPVPPRKPLNGIRPGPRRHRELLRSAAEGASGSLPTGQVLERASALVVMNDWGPTRTLVDESRSSGRPTFGVVEGVQDFDDVDTGRTREPYRHVDHVLCLGSYDRRRLAECDVTVVGSTRLRSLWEAAPASPPPDGHVTVNSNFTYGVFTDIRRRWLRDAMGSCRTTGIAHSLSRHVAERGTALPYRASKYSVSSLLARSSHLITRFSTLGYEALTRGVEVLYHNPHAEKVETFVAIDGAVTMTVDRAGLVVALSRSRRSPGEVRDAACDFLHDRLRLDGEQPATVAARAIASAVQPG